MKPPVSLFALLVLSGNLLAADYVVEPGSTLTFTGVFQGEEFSGSFGKFDATIRYDAEKLDSSSFDVSVDLDSASTGDKDRDDALPGSDFFNVGKFPKAHFATRKISKSGNEILAEGTLSLKGVDKPVNLVVTFAPKDAGATLDVTTRIDRLDFGVGGGEYADTSTIANEVRVNAHLLLRAK